MTDQPKGLFKTAISDPAVRLAALGGALGGAVLVLAVVLIVGGPKKAPTPPPAAQESQVAKIDAPPPQHVRQPVPTLPSRAEPVTGSTPLPVPADPAPLPAAPAPAMEAYPDLPVARVEPAPTGPAPTVDQNKTKPEAPSAPPPDMVGPPPADKPMIAIVIDDMGVDQRRSARAMKLPAKVTLSFLPYSRDLKAQAAEARKLGHEIMLHVAMEPESPEADPGPNVLLTGVPEQELLTNLRWNLGQMDGYAGINNHMGSRFTRDLAGMRTVMAELKERGLFFLDSVTSRDSVGAKTAKEAGVAYATRDVFIDHKDDEAFVRKQLERLEAKARKHGSAIAIGHPRDITLRALKTWLPKVQAAGFELVGASRLLHRPAPSPTHLSGTSG
ncbi:MAG: hypothetical protein CMM61_13020 [Rhodospirillaceae bacterium]|nr:hypothetical protein [Rhodospirillaceae bacterium]